MKQSTGDEDALKFNSPTFLPVISSHKQSFSTMNISDIHNKKKQITHSLERTRLAGDVTTKNKELIVKFYDHCVAEDLSLGRILSYLEMIRKMAAILNKDFDTAGKEDIEKLLRILIERGYADSTKRDFKITIKKFYKWMRETEGYPDEVRWIKTTIKNKPLPDCTLTEDDVQKLVEAAEYPRDKALTYVLYESGCRIGEILTLRLKDIRFDIYGAEIFVNGKTGGRRVRIIASSPLLSNWIASHPYRNDPEAPLWICVGNRAKNVPMRYTAVASILKRLKARSGIKKRIHPHLFRHARATQLAQHLTEFQLKKMFGWTLGSRMAATYVHTSGLDFDSKLLELNGIKKADTKESNADKPRKCPRCDKFNIPKSKFCFSCGMAFDIKTLINIDNDNRFAGDILKDPKVQEFLIERMKELNCVIQ